MNGIKVTHFDFVFAKFAKHSYQRPWILVTWKQISLLKPCFVIYFLQTGIFLSEIVTLV